MDGVLGFVANYPVAAAIAAVALIILLPRMIVAKIKNAWRKKTLRGSALYEPERITRISKRR